MALRKILAVAVLLIASAGGDRAPAAPAPTTATLPSLPPPRVADCVSFALLDDKCTTDWYVCRRGANPASCVEAWQDCCTLPGQGARSRLGGAEAVSSNR
jgi:hypothetical protein